MKTDKTSADKGTSRAVTEGPTSTTGKGSHPTNQMNCTSASEEGSANCQGVATTLNMRNGCDGFRCPNF